MVQIEGRSYIDLMRHPENMTEHEQERLKNIEYIPCSVRYLVVKELAKVQNAQRNMEELQLYRSLQEDEVINLQILDNREEELIKFLEGEWRKW